MRVPRGEARYRSANLRATTKPPHAETARPEPTLLLSPEPPETLAHPSAKGAPMHAAQLGPWLGALQRGAAACLLGAALVCAPAPTEAQGRRAEAGVSPSEVRIVLEAPRAPRERVFFLRRTERLGLDEALTRGGISGAELRTLVGAVEDVQQLENQMRSGVVGAADTYRDLLELGGLEGISKPTAAQLLDPTSGGDYVVIAPGAMESHLLPLLRHRAQAGLRPVLLSPEVIEGATGARGVTGISEVLREANRRWDTRPRFVLLVGDPTALADAPAVPYEERKSMGHGLTRHHFASDHRFSDLDGDHLPELAVGRLPVRTPAELAGVVDKLVSHDVGPPGEWQLKATLVDGDPGWGDWSNWVVDRYTKVRAAHAAAPASQIERLSFNPTRAKGDEYARLGRILKDGRLLVSYFGHGRETSVDGLSVGDVSRIRSDGAHPIVLINACLAGEFGSGLHSLAAALVNDSGGAAIAVAASDITLPHTNADWGEVLAFEVLAGGKPTAGEAFVEAKRRYGNRETAWLPRTVRRIGDRFVDAQIGHDAEHSHLYLYNLMGDPATPIRRALPLEVELRGINLPGETLQLHVRPVSGDRLQTGWVQLERPDGVRLTNPSPLHLKTSSMDGSLELPQELQPGRYFVRVGVVGELDVYSTLRPLDIPEPFHLGS